jgi:hypothetical protein
MKIVRDFRRTGISKPRKIRENQGAMSGVLKVVEGKTLVADQAIPTMFRNRSLFGCRNTPLWSVIQPRIDRYHVGLRFESLESRRMLDAASWITVGSGNWDLASNWSSGTVPTSTTDVTINPTVASTITILPGEADTVNSVTVGSNATLSVSSPDYTNPTSNLLTNPGFESPETTNGKTSPAYWNTWINPTGTGLAYLSTSYAHTGTQSFVVSGTNCGADLPAARIAATAGDSYTLSVYAMTPGLTGNADGYLNLYFYNASGTSTGDSSINILNSSSAAGGPLAGSVGALGWNHFYTTMVAPANSVTMDAQMTLWDPSGSGSVYFDDVALGPTATADPSSLTAGSISNSGTILVGPTDTLTTSGTLTQTSTGVLDVGTTAAAGASTLTAASISNSGTVLVGPGSTATVSGALTQTSTGTFELGPAAAAGASTLTAASISNSGLLLIGPKTTATISGTFTQTSTGTLDLQLGGTSSGSYGFVNVAGAATLAGTLKSDLVDSYTPSTTADIMPMEYASESGTFATVTMPGGTGYQLYAAATFTNVVVSGAPSAATTATINAATVLHPVTTNLLGVNLVDWDGNTGSSQTESLEEAAGLDFFRIPGGSGADGWHFNSSSGTPNFAQFLEAIDAVNGTGLITTDYGSGSPQEAAAELAYVDGSPTDATPLYATTPTEVDNIEWENGAWVNVTTDGTNGWDTVGFWASLRGESPITPNDGLNFLRVDHPAAFTGITYWEIGNEEYGSWETDNHGTAGPNGSTGAQHDPATYALFASEFAGLAREIQTTAGLPMVYVGIDSANPNGSGDNNWTYNVLKDGYADTYTYNGTLYKFVPGFISDHNYVQGPGSENDYNLLNATVTQSGNILNWATRYSDYENSLNETVGTTNAATVQVMTTEYNTVYSDPGKQSTSLVNGLFVAESLGVLLDTNYVGGIIWDLRNGFSTSQNNSNLLYGWREGGDYGLLGGGSDAPITATNEPYPDYFALQLCSKIVESGGEVVSASDNYGELYTYAVKEADGDLDLLVINANPAAAITNQFDISGFNPSGSATVWQYGETQDTAQKNSSSGTTALSDTTTTLTLTGSDFSYTFPAYSMTVLDLAVVPLPPTVATPAAATPSPAAGTSTALSVLGAYNGGESNLTYTWAATTLPSGAAAPVFSANGTNAAKNTTATFSQAGTYSFTVTITNPGGQTVTSGVSVTVNPTFTSIALSPSGATVAPGGQKQFTATAEDQFGAALAAQPAFTWSVYPLAGGGGIGSINASGLFTAGSAQLTGAVTVASGAVSASAVVGVSTLPAPVAWYPFAEGSGTTLHDASGNGFNGTLSSSGATWGAGGAPPGSGGDLTFSSGSVNLGSPAGLNVTGDITLSAWIDPKSSSGSYQDIVGRGYTESPDAETMLRINSGDYQVVAWNGTNYEASAAVPAGDLNTWVQLVGIYNGTAWLLYRDGVLLTSTASTVGALSVAANWMIGSSGISTDARYFNGSIGDVRIYNVALSAAQVATLYDSYFPPTIATPAAASPATVAATSTALSALGASVAGASSLTYTWAATTLPAGATPPTFLPNGSNAAASTTASFTKAGPYVLTVTITDALGRTVTSSVPVTVNQTLTSITVSPSSASLDVAQTKQFTATANDQFEIALASQPTFAWSSSAGQVSNAGLLTASSSAVSNGTVTASSNGVSGSSQVAVMPPPQVVGVYVSGSAWNSGSTGLFSALAAAGVGSAALGYELASGAGQLSNADVPGWVNMNVISIVFSEPVSGVTAASLSLGDSSNNGGPSSGTTVSGENNASTTVATFTLSGALTSNKYFLDLAATGITDAAGTPLDGAWSTGLSTFAAGSGDGSPGSNFVYRFNVLAGDVNGDGKVSAADVAVVGKQPPSPSDNAANWRYDINGAGKVTVADVALVGSQPPAAIASFPEPVLPGAGAVAASNAVAVSGLAGGPLVQTTASVAAPLVMPRPAPAVGPQAERLGKSVSAGAWGTSAGERFVGPSIAGRMAADLDWLAQTANRSDDSGQQQKDAAIEALDALFGEYGR